jgi:hypothetical protein
VYTWLLNSKVARLVGYVVSTMVKSIRKLS